MKPLTSILPGAGPPVPSGGNPRALEAYAKFKAQKAAESAQAATPKAATLPQGGEYPLPKSKKEANAMVGGLSAPGKMPEGSFGTSAHDCKTGSALRQVTGSTCSTCYAHKGMYVMPNVKDAHAKRLGIINEALADPEKRKSWIGAMVKLMDGKKHFRWHDSGDIQSPEHLGMLADVARATPDTKHWLPTKEPRFVKRYQDKGGVIPDNLIVRMSAPHNDTDPPKQFANTSTVHKMKDAPAGSYVCPAKDQEGECNGAKHGGKDCRECWNPAQKNVSYPWH